MYGRGLIARPYLLDAIMQKEDGEDHREEYRKKLRQFHDRLYRDYQEYLSGEQKCTFPHEGIVELYGTRLYQLCQISEKDQKIPAFW